MPTKNTRTQPKKAAEKTREQWATDITSAHKQTIEDIFKMGRMLIAAKRALKHGEFEMMVEHDLPFCAATAQRLMKIARDPRLRKAARVQVLPMAWGTLYELTKLSDAQFEQAMASGAINPQTTRRKVMNFTVTERPLLPLATAASTRTVELPARASLEASRITYEQADPPTRKTVIPVFPNVFPNMKLRQIEELVNELKTEVARGGVFIAVDIERARSIAGKLQAIATSLDPGQARAG